MPMQEPENVSMAKRYYLSSFLKGVFILGLVMLLFSTMMNYFTNRYTAVESPGGIIPFVVMDVLYLAVLIWRIKTPLVEISDAGIKVSAPFVFKKNTAGWEEIEGMTINEISNLGIKERQVKILIRTAEESTRELVFSLRSVEKPEEILLELRAGIPEKGYEDIRKSPALQKPVLQKEVPYRGWTATERGLSGKRDFIPWEMIRELKYPALVIGGYGATTVTYVGSGGIRKNITIKASSSEAYLTFLRYLIQRSQKAVIDPGLVKVLDYSPKDARTDLISSMLLVFGIVLLFVTPIIIMYYSAGISTGYRNILLLIPFGLVPALFTIRGLLRRFRGEAPATSGRMLWPTLSALGPVIAVLVFFMISPFSFYWLSGDIARKAGSSTLAEHYYQASLKQAPGNIDVLHELGKLYLKEKKYEQALPYLKEAYRNDPTWWGPQAVILVPDTLMKVRKYDEALQWCERVLKDRPNKIDIAQAISRKQDEIISEKSHYERQQNIKEYPPGSANSPAASGPQPAADQLQEAANGPIAGTTEIAKEDPEEVAQTPLRFSQPAPSTRIKADSSIGMMRFLSGYYSGNRTIDFSINIVIYLYFCFCLFFIAMKLRTKAPWTAWIPVVNLWTVVSAAGKPWWWLLLLLIPIANIFIWINLWMRISENAGRNKWLGLLMLVPLASLVFLGILAFPRDENA